MTAATQWLERTLDDSANRRLSIPDAYLSLDGALVLAENVSAGLVVHPAVVRKNLDVHLPFMAMESLLMHEVERGGDRQELHETIRRHSLAAASRMKEGLESDLVDRVAEDPDFRIGKEELEALMTPERFIGRAPEQVDTFLERQVQPVLERLSAEADQIVGAPDVRV